MQFLIAGSAMTFGGLDTPCNSSELRAVDAGAFKLGENVKHG
jgi:hypothetical protein